MKQAIWNGAVIAESDETVFIEGNHYFPVNKVNKQYLQSSNTHTFCPWKGEASYYSLEVDGKVNQDAAWYYATPSNQAKAIKDHIAFWRGVEIKNL
ncbi:MAG: DUF427 domain-containing protein [Saprospiraceae bacterium]|nr:DUF427 domain-containing protein [Saprospiraceae bacterium]MCB9342605.1 DUF427 domain-containing protein [Lewinellaceae bacterium]